MFEQGRVRGWVVALAGRPCTRGRWGRRRRAPRGPPGTRSPRSTGQCWSRSNLQNLDSLTATTLLYAGSHVSDVVLVESRSKVFHSLRIYFTDIWNQAFIQDQFIALIYIWEGSCRKLRLENSSNPFGVPCIFTNKGHNHPWASQLRLIIV